MSRKIINTNIRLNLDSEDDRRAWERLQKLDRTRYKSYSRAVVAALNDFFDRQERLDADPYLETREKENAFLQKVMDAVEYGLRSVISPGPLSAARFPRNAPAADNAKTDTDNAALAFIDSF